MAPPLPKKKNKKIASISAKGLTRLLRVKLKFFATKKPRIWKGINFWKPPQLIIIPGILKKRRSNGPKVFINKGQFREEEEKEGGRKKRLIQKWFKNSSCWGGAGRAFGYPARDSFVDVKFVYQITRRGKSENLILKLILEYKRVVAARRRITTRNIRERINFCPPHKMSPVSRRESPRKNKKIVGAFSDDDLILKFWKRSKKKKKR